MKGRCHEALGDEASARRVAEMLDGQWPGSAQGPVIHGRLAARSGDAARSESCPREALRRDPQCALACLGLARMRQDAGDDQACLDWLEQALRFHPTSREIVLAFHERLNALERLARGEDAFRAVLREHPLNRRLRFLLIDILLRQGKLDSAMAEIESAMADFGVDPGMLAAAQSVRERVGPRRGAGGMDSVSLCMIVKNEEANLARCLRSVTPVVDEIVIVDTGSTDRTRDIATAFGARVADVPWNDDFSAVRNAGLEMVGCEWIFVLDADEVLSTRDHDQFRQTIRAATTRPAAFRMRTRNYTRHVNAVGWRANVGEYPEEEGPGWIPSNKVRLFTQGPGASASSSPYTNWSSPRCAAQALLSAVATSRCITTASFRMQRPRRRREPIAGWNTGNCAARMAIRQRCGSSRSRPPSWGSMKRLSGSGSNGSGSILNQPRRI